MRWNRRWVQARRALCGAGAACAAASAGASAGALGAQETGGAPPAQASPGAGGTIAGVVSDASGNQIAAVEVRVPGTAFGTRTDASGAFLLRQLPLGATTLEIRRLGFKPRLVPAVVEAGFVEPLSVVLDRAAQLLPAVRVLAGRRQFSGRMADFHRRRTSKAGGYFFTAAQIDSIRPHRSTDLLRRVPGVTVTSLATGQNEVRMRGMRCPPLVWMDNMPLSAGYFDPDFLDPRTIEGIEIYNGLASVPLQLMGPRSLGSCGVIAIWSRTGLAPRRARKKGKDLDHVTAEQLAALNASLQVYTAAQVDRPAAPAQDEELLLPYPEALRRSATPGVVIVEFVVDTTGQVEPATIGLVSSTHPLFSRAVEGRLNAARFVPAELGGRAVRQVVQLPVHFVPAGDEPEPAPR